MTMWTDPPEDRDSSGYADNHDDGMKVLAYSLAAGFVVVVIVDVLFFLGVLP